MRDIVLLSDGRPVRFLCSESYASRFTGDERVSNASCMASNAILESGWMFLSAEEIREKVKNRSNVSIN